MKRSGIATKATQSAIKEVLTSDASKSGKMKMLFDLGLEVKEIAVLMKVRYNFVYNVVSNYCIMNGLNVETTQKESKKDAILEMHKKGATNKAIAIELKCNANYVFNTVKQYKREQEAATAVVETKQDK
jgi:hypothetical protein